MWTAFVPILVQRRKKNILIVLLICADTFVQWFFHYIKARVSHELSAPCHSFIRSGNGCSEVNVILSCSHTAVLVASKTSCFQLSALFFFLSKIACLYFLALNYLSRLWRIYLPWTNTALPDRSFICEPVKMQSLPKLKSI